MASDGLLCWSCGKPTGHQITVGRGDSCDNCGADLRCCRGCRHFAPGKRWQCKENIERPEVDKERANFCDFFQIRQAMKRAGGVEVNTKDEKESRKRTFDDLFKD